MKKSKLYWIFKWENAWLLISQRVHKLQWWNSARIGMLLDERNVELQCMPIIFMTHRSFSVFLSSHIGSTSVIFSIFIITYREPFTVPVNLHRSWPTDWCYWHRLELFHVKSLSVARCKKGNLDLFWSSPTWHVVVLTGLVYFVSTRYDEQGHADP